MVGAGQLAETKSLMVFEFTHDRASPIITAFYELLRSRRKNDLFVFNNL